MRPCDGDTAVARDAAPASGDGSRVRGTSLSPRGRDRRILTVVFLK